MARASYRQGKFVEMQTARSAQIRTLSQFMVFSTLCLQPARTNASVTPLGNGDFQMRRIVLTVMLCLVTDIEHTCTDTRLCCQQACSLCHSSGQSCMPSVENLGFGKYCFLQCVLMQNTIDKVVPEAGTL